MTLRRVRVVLLTLAAGLICLASAPVAPDPASWTRPPAPALAGAYAPSTTLASVERLAKGIVLGPEDLAVDRDGDLLAGAADGRILRYSAAGGNIERP